VQDLGVHLVLVRDVAPVRRAVVGISRAPSDQIRRRAAVIVCGADSSALPCINMTGTSRPLEVGGQGSAPGICTGDLHREQHLEDLPDRVRDQGGGHPGPLPPVAK